MRSWGQESSGVLRSLWLESLPPAHEPPWAHLLQHPGMRCWLCALSPGFQPLSHQIGLLTGPPPSCSSSFVCGCILCLRGRGGSGAGQGRKRANMKSQDILVHFFPFFFLSTGNLDRTGIDIFYNFCPCLLEGGLGGSAVTYF